MIIKEGISIIVCCYNSSMRLESTLRYLAQQEFPKKILGEIILVDNNSTDNTTEYARLIWTELKSTLPLKIVFEPEAGLSYAREKGIQTANYEYIIFCDDDNWLAPNYIAETFNIMKSNPSVGIIGGVGEGEFIEAPPYWFKDVEKRYAIGSIANDGVLNKGYVIYGAGMVLRKSVWLKLKKLNFKPILSDRKGKSLSSGGDTELCLVIQLLGYRIYYSNQLCFKHFMPPERLKLSYYKKLISSMVYSNFILLTYVCVLKNIKPNIINYCLVSIFLISKKGMLFIYQSLFQKNSAQKLDNYFTLKTFLLFLTHRKVFMENWVKIHNKFRNKL